MSNSKPPSITGSVVRVALATLLWVLLLVVLVVVVPRERKKFDDFGMSVPTVTQILVDVSMFFEDYWWLAVFAAIPVVIGTGIATYYLRNRSGSPMLIVFWSLFLFVPPILLQLVVWWALYLPLQKLQEGLSR